MNEQTIEKMRTMKLFGMLRAFQTNLETDTAVRYTPDELVGLMVSSEWDDRYNRKLDRSVLRARFRYKASIEQISFTNERELHKNQLLRLADCDFIKKKENLLITGSTGIGKSFIASALGHQACSLGYKVQYEHCTKLFSRLKMGKADGTYLKEIAKIEKQIKSIESEKDQAKKEQLANDTYKQVELTSSTFFSVTYHAIFIPTAA